MLKLFETVYFMYWHRPIDELEAAGIEFYNKEDYPKAYVHLRILSERQPQNGEVSIVHLKSRLNLN